MNTLGNRVKAIIDFNDETMSSFSRKLNISPSMVSKICNDKAIPSDRTISNICFIYNVTRDWILNGAGERPMPYEKRLIALNNKQILALKAVAYGCNKNKHLRGASYVVFSDPSDGKDQEISFYHALNIVYGIIDLLNGGAE